MAQGAKENIIGNIYGDLEVIGEDKPYKSRTSSSFSRKAICKCKCGNVTVVALTNLRQRKTKTCGNCILHIEALENEEWKDIPGYEGLYWASNLGRVRGQKGILKYANTNTDYLTISLSKGKRGSYYKTGVHRLVMYAFNGISKLDVNHKDGDKSNNKLENLEYVTKSENMKHAYATGLCKVKKGKDNHLFGIIGKDHKDSIKVNQLTLEGEFIKTWDSIADVRRSLNLSSGNICSVCKGTRKQTGGFKWEYC